MFLESEKKENYRINLKPITMKTTIRLFLHFPVNKFLLFIKEIKSYITTSQCGLSTNKLSEARILAVLDFH